MPGLLYRISTPAGSGLAPHVSVRGGQIRAALRPTGGEGPDEVRIVLNSAVRWDIRLPAGAGEQQLDLAHGRVSGVQVGASGLIELALPRPAGTVGVTFTGGAGTATVTAPAGVPVRLALEQGAGSVTTPWTGVGPAAPGSMPTAPGWAAAQDRYVVHARSGVGAVTLHRSVPTPA